VKTLDSFRWTPALALAGSLCLAGCGFHAATERTTANADGSLALVERTEPVVGVAGGKFETLYIEARGGSSGSRYQIAGFQGERELHAQWIGRTTLTLCIDPAPAFLVSEIKVRPTPDPASGYNGGFAQALGGPASISVIQACAGDATAAPPRADDPAATAAPAAADG
jgi:hypothetical protein